MIVHRFPGNTSAEVYAFSQTCDVIKDGDVLVVPDEDVVGVLVGAWPVAASPEHGSFHPTQPGFDWANVAWDEQSTKDYRASHVAAQAEIVGTRLTPQQPKQVIWARSYAAA